MLFAVICKDKPDHLEVRKANRPDHVAYLGETGGPASVVFAGPFLDEDGEAMIGSMVVIDAADRTAAERWAANDPYAKADLFASTEILPWKRAVG